MKILGISPMHDSSVAVIEDGNVALFLKEERLSGVKRDIYPFLSIDRAIDLHPDIDLVCMASPTPNPQLITPLSFYLRKMIDKKEIMYCDRHHLCHASLAFYNSGFENALVFVIDRNGSAVGGRLREAETVFKASYPCTFETLHKNFWLSDTGVNADRHNIHAAKQLHGHSFNADSQMSIVKVYESATTLIGQNPLESGKTMGLSSYGKPGGDYDLFYKRRPIDSLFVHSNEFNPDPISGLAVTIFRDHIDKRTSEITPDNYQFYADYCRAVQVQTQEQVRQFVKHWVDKTGIKKVCITGGYGLNVVANSYLLCSFDDVDFYFEPLADDSGNSIGAAMHLYREMTGDTKIRKLKHTFFHGTQHDLKSCGQKCTAEDISYLLEEQKTVAVFNGLAEAGPRALGNRSILFDASNRNAKEIVNGIKKREWYRPFAAVVLEEDFSAYFTTPVWNSEFMTVSFDVDEDMAKSIPGVVHVDGSCRVQTVDSSIPHLYNLLTEFNERTGCPVLLNTSFNLAGQPLIETQEQALECLANSDLDAVWFPELEEVVVK